jgi:beta-N-acetylhexosaminidase
MCLFFKIFLTIILFRTLNIYKLSKLVDFFHLSKEPIKMKELKDLSIKEKIGQLFIIRVRGKELSDETIKMIREYKIGNFIIFANNYQNLIQISKLINDIYKKVLASIGIIPFIAIDQEGGNTARIKDKSTYYPGPMTISATKLSNAKEIGHMMGKHLISLGININFAPLLDINNNPENPVINIRSFSDQINIVSKYGIEMIKSIQEEGIIATAKHFPGHGDTEIDSHFGLPILNFDKERIYNMELKPFKEAIN